MYQQHSTLFIFGAGGHGKVCADIAMKMNLWNEIYFVDDYVSEDEIMGVPVLNKGVSMRDFVDQADLFVAIGDNYKRAKFIEQFDQDGWNIVSIIHPSAIIGNCVDIGRGTCVMPNVVINSVTKIDLGCILNTACTVDHDNKIGQYVHISPGAHLAGSVKIGDYTWVGIGSVVSQNVSIPRSVIIGAGTTIHKTILTSGTFVGTPFRRIR